MSATVLLDCDAIVKRFGGLWALRGATMQVKTGEILGLVGPNGSGKTTLINVISGQYRADGGRLLFDGHDVTHYKPNQLAHSGVARTYQIPRPFASLTVAQNVAMAWMFGRKSHTHTEALELSQGTLDFVGLGAKAKAPVSKLNLHERKFLEMARALALEPKLLLLDEVLAGLNPSEVELGIELIQRIRDQGITIVFVEHNIRAVTRLSDRMVVLNYGQKIAEGLPEAVVHDPAVVAAYLGHEDVSN